MGLGKKVEWRIEGDREGAIGVTQPMLGSFRLRRRVGGGEEAEWRELERGSGRDAFSERSTWYGWG